MHLHDDVENGIDKEVDHEDGQQVCVEVYAVHRQLGHGEYNVAEDPCFQKVTIIRLLCNSGSTPVALHFVIVTDDHQGQALQIQRF